MRLNEILALNKTVQGVVEEKGTLWRVHQSEATGRYHVVKGYNKNIKMFKNKIGAGDFTSKEAAQSKAKELNQGVAEGFDTDTKFNGIVMSIIEGEDGFKLTAKTPNGQKLGFVEFSYDTDGTIRAEELEVYEKHRGRGIAKAMYDYVKSQGFTIARSSEQTPGGAAFWDKNRPGNKVWEQGVAEGKFGAQGLAQSLKKPGKTGGPGFDISAAEKRNAEFAEKLKAQAEEIHGRRLDDLARRYGAEVVATAYKKSGNNLDKTRAYLKSTYDDDMTEQQDQPINETAAWKRKEGKSKTGGLNKKGVASYRRENPGSKLQTAVTTKPSKLKPGSKAAKRRKSFCARMGGMKGPMKKPNGKPTRKALALRKWNCESIDRMVQDFENELNEIIEVKQRLDPKCWKGKHKEGTKIKGGIRVNNCVPNK